MVLHKNHRKYKGGQAGFRNLYHLEGNTDTSACNDHGIWDMLRKSTHKIYKV